MSIPKRETNKTIEFTGVPCSGKSTIINYHFRDHHILMGSMPATFNTKQRVFWSIFLCLYALLNNLVNSKQLLWLVSRAIRYDESLLSRINAFRNCLSKFGYKFFQSKKPNTITDEGISHIPFVLGLSEKRIKEFADLFKDELSHFKIYFIESPSVNTLKYRISTRGHKRVRSIEEVNSFISKNIEIADNYKKTLTNRNFDVHFIKH